MYIKFLAVLGLCWYAGFFSSCDEWGYSVVAVYGCSVRWLLSLQSTGSSHTGFISWGKWTQ